MDHEVILNNVLTYLAVTDAVQLLELTADRFWEREAVIVHLAPGVTPRRPEGYATFEASVESRRDVQTMRPVTDRRSHLRWAVVPTGSVEARERLGSNVRLRRAEAVRAVLPRPDGWTPRALVTA